MTKHRQSEGSFGDEHVASYAFEGCACRIGEILVVAGGDNPEPVCRNLDLGRTKDVSGGVKGHLGAVELDRLSVGDGLGRPSEIFPVAQSHEVECFLRGKNCAMPGARVIGMAMRDHRFVDRPSRVDVESAKLATPARG